MSHQRCRRRFLILRLTARVPTDPTATTAPLTGPPTARLPTAIAQKRAQIVPNGRLAAGLNGQTARSVLIGAVVATAGVTGTNAVIAVRARSARSNPAVPPRARTSQATHQSAPNVAGNAPVRIVAGRIVAGRIVAATRHSGATGAAAGTASAVAAGVTGWHRVRRVARSVVQSAHRSLRLHQP